MAQNTRRITDDAHGITEEHICQCGHDKYCRQSSSHSSTRVFAGVSSPPAMRSDSSDSQVKLEAFMLATMVQYKFRKKAVLR